MSCDSYYSFLASLMLWRSLTDKSPLFSGGWGSSLRSDSRTERFPPRSVPGHRREDTLSAHLLLYHELLPCSACQAIRRASAFKPVSMVERAVLGPNGVRISTISYAVRQRLYNLGRRVRQLLPWIRDPGYGLFSVRCTWRALPVLNLTEKM